MRPSSITRSLNQLGSNNRMVVARWYNSLWKGKYEDTRKDLFAARLAHRDPRPHIADGWALDKSRKLPHLNSLLEDAAGIIQSRSSAVPPHGRTNLLKDSDLFERQSFISFAVSERVATSLSYYFGMIPVLSAVKLFKLPLTTTVPGSQSFRLATDARPQVKIYIYTNDSAPSNTHVTFVPKNTSHELANRLRYGSFRGLPAVPIRIMYENVDRRELIKITQSPGSVLFIDPSQCFHRRSQAAEVNHIIMFQYTAPVRTDFRRPTFAKYIKPGDGRLTQAILNPAYGSG